MTADSEKDSTRCLVCNSKVGVSTRNSIRIFEEDAPSNSNRFLIDVIRSVLETDLNEESAHSLVICKKCFKLFTEVEELERRLIEIKTEVSGNYRKTVNKFSAPVVIEEEYNDHDYIETGSSPNHDETEKPSENDENHNDSCESSALDMDEMIAKSDESKNEENVEKEIVNEDEKMEEENVSGTKSGESEDLEDSDDANDDVCMQEDHEEEEIEEKKGNKNVKKNVKVETAGEKIVSRDEDMYTCLLCSDEEEKCDARGIIAHMKSAHDLRLYICDLCGQEFRKRTDLSFHLDDHVAKEEGDFQCEICNRIFCNLRLFRIHKRIHYPQVKSWSCETCGKRYSSRNLLEEHTNTHTGVRPYICGVCGKDFASKYTHRAHVKTHEVRPRPFECTLCNKSFLSQQNLTQHEKTHNGIKEYVCHQCGKAFGSAHNLEVHNIVHTGYKPYICRICGKAFARKAEIRDHERTHTGEKPYQCEFCGATFSQRSNLQSHKRATHYNDKRYKCEDCGKGFKRRRLLDYHIKAAHTGERPFKCDICTATFVYPEHFKKHMRIHTGEKPYLCEVCGKAFNSRDNRNAHRFIHSDKKPYECLVCGMGFMRKPLLYTHMQTQGHMNDTIVVNQPRLTTEDEVMIRDESVQNVQNVQLLIEGGEQLQHNAVIVTELKDHMIIQEGGDQIYKEENILGLSEGTIASDDINQLVVNGQLHFEQGQVLQCKDENNEAVEEVFGFHETEDGQAIVVPAGTDYKEIMGDKNAVRLVQIRIPSSTSGETRSWLSLVQNT